MIPGLSYDEDLIVEVSRRFDLRHKNIEALRSLLRELTGEYDPEVPLVLGLATGAGKTYIMAALVEYLGEHGIQDVLIVTPGRIVQAKTVENFTEGSLRYISGAEEPPVVITPADYDAWRPDGAAARLSNRQPVQLFILTVHQLIAPREAEGSTSGATLDGVRRSFRKTRESSGNLREYLSSLDNLVIIADEHHLYGDSAQAFRSGIHELKPAAVVGLTASASPEDHVVFTYSLKQAITDRVVKRPVIAFRRRGYGEHAEEQQLRDALALLREKQRHYSLYHQAHPDEPAVNAALFVQCADVAHATSVAHLLRGPEFFDSEGAVLQVDNAHDDAVTLQRLSQMDQPYSTVRCVVSVNKLKEGWDVKNIAVMVTLRAMASEILTQQTLGRGLRLPFGKWTEFAHINQLDVLAHEAFSTYLKREDILASFGLDGAAGTPDAVTSDPGQGPSASPPSPDAPGPTGDTPETALPDTADTPTGSPTTPGENTAPGAEGASTQDLAGGAVGVIIIEDGAELTGGDDAEEPAVIRMNVAFQGQTFLFPSTHLTAQSSPLRLVSIDNKEVIEAARRVTDQGGVLTREAIVFRGETLSTKQEDDVRVASIAVTTKQAEQDLIENVLKSRWFDSSNNENVKALSGHIVPLLMSEVRTSEWTEKLLRSALQRLQEVLQRAANAHNQSLTPVMSIQPVRLPIRPEYPLPPGRRVLEVLQSQSTSADFTKHEYYGPWSKGLFNAAAFDSYSGEYLIAGMLNRSTSIQWWTRLYPSDNAVIAYNARDTYHPDFVAYDNGGYHWIIEGKAENKREDAEVQAKRRAAETAVRLLATDDRFAGQKWGYVIAYEKDIAQADSWEDLLAGADPVKTLTH